MASPLIAQGTISKLRASVIFPAAPQLTVTAPYLGTEGISIVLEGKASTNVQTMTGFVTSPEPYLMVTIQMHLLKTQILASLYKTQMEVDVRLGDCVVRPDTTTLTPYLFYNSTITSVGDLLFNGTNPGYGVVVEAFYPINATLWDGG